MSRPLAVDDALPAPQPASGEVAALHGMASARRWWRRFARNRGAVFGLAVFLAVVVMALFANVLAPYDPIAQGVGPANEGPTWSHWARTASGATC
jgi:dipeptide transport system permease protein